MASRDHNSSSEAISATVRRLRVFKYNKSGRLAAIFPHDRFGVMVLELSPDMKKIEKFRQAKYVPRAAVLATDYQIEVREELSPSDQGKSLVSYNLIRVLTKSDIDPAKWMSAASLRELPVSPEPDPTPEELLWAGKREGNLGGGYALIAALVVAAAIAIYGYLDGFNFIFPLVIASISGVFLINYTWKAPVAPDVAKLAQLEAHKRQMRLQSAANRAAAMTQFQDALKRFETWQALSAEQFELALSLRLKDEGYEVKQTRYSKDGGIDIEAVDQLQKPMIVQVKKYAANVGVNVIREMIGIRVNRADKPRTMVYSLSGFTRGAKELALQSGVELRDIKSELLKI